MTTTPEETQDLPPAPVAEQSDLPLVDGYVLMPRELTAENGAKYLLSGEYSESVTLHCAYCDEEDDGCEICNGAGEYSVDVPVEWTTIKDIYRRAVEHLAQPAPVAEELSGEPVAWMHDKDGRVDVIHKDVKKLLADWDTTKQGTGEGFHRPLATVAHYTIPLYTRPQPAVPEGWKLQLIRAYTDGYGAGHEATVEGAYAHIYQCDRDEYFAEHMEDWIKDNLAAPAKPAVPDVDALAEFIRSTDRGYEGYEEFAQRICNWIEEQRQ